MKAEEYKAKIEQDILKLLKERLSEGKMSTEHAQEIAKFVLGSLKPHMTIDEIHRVVKSFDEHFPELLPALLPIIKEYDDKVKEIVLKQVEELIDQKDIGKAVEVLNEALDDQGKAQ